MSKIPNSVLDAFLSNLDAAISEETDMQGGKKIVAFLVKKGYIKEQKIRAHMVNVLYEKAKLGAKSKTDAINSVAAQVDIDEKQVRNILGNLSKY